jgi:hypothetical protein
MNHMAAIDQKVLQTVNRPGRLSVLATADKSGRPDVAYFGSPVLNPDGTLVMGLGENRSLKNLMENPHAAYFTVETSPVSIQTPGWRLYLTVKEIQRQGPVVDGVKKAIADAAGEAAAAMIVAGVVLTVDEVRPLVDMG